ncbi:MAG: hypothetical protein K2J63_12410 [Muribaculaceae bacterium]|nr:hypothetical protein [Muribaculaceae bacterium]
MDNFALRCCNRLQKQGFSPEQNWAQRKMLSVSENGKNYKVSVVNGAFSAVFQIDGNVIKDGQKCDKFLVAKRADGSDNAVAVFIELKGKDISHAIDQLEETIKNPLFRPYPAASDKTRARIITPSCGPTSASRIKLEEARIRFKRQYNVELRVLKNSQPDTPLDP